MQIYNLFYQHVDTEIRFDGIENFAAGQAARVYYGNAISNNEQDAAVDWGYAVNSLYLQDEWQINDRLAVTIGLRYEWYESSDKPNVNPDFVADYGFSNDANLDNLGYGAAALRLHLGCERCDDDPRRYRLVLGG